MWAHRDLKRAKEIFAVSILAKILSKQDKRGVWWMTKLETDPPDGLIGLLLQNGDLPEMHVREIEVVEHIEGDLLTTIRTKLGKKQYEENTALVCLVSDSKVYNFEEQSKIISEEITSLNHIFLVFPGFKLADLPESASQEELLRTMLTISCVQLKPVYSYDKIDIIADCKEWAEGKEPNFFIFEGRGKTAARAVTLENPPKLF